MERLTGTLHRIEQRVNDALRGLVSARIEADPAFWLVRGKPGTMIVVEAASGIVTLSGFVRSASERARAESIARRLGALGVDNRLRLTSVRGQHLS